MSQNIDLTNCEREPIQFLGHVQTFGCLFALSRDWIVVHASRNVTEFFGKSLDDFIGSPFRNVVSDDAVHDIRGALQLLSGPNSVERIYNVPAHPASDCLFDVTVHLSGDKIVVELQPASGKLQKDTLSTVRPMLERLKRTKSVEDLCTHAARHIKALTGFDRVMVYKFLPDQSGEVVAEAAKAELEPYLGLRYPASDIPQQARQLYKRNLLRIISDVDDQVSEIVPNTDPQDKPLDLSLSALRAVSPIHLEYLRNMGVQASMSISILHRGKLWGLFACHHYEKRVLSYDLRSASELFAEIFGFLLDERISDAQSEYAHESRQLHDKLMARLAEGDGIDRNFEVIVEALDETIPFNGVAGWIEGQLLLQGKTPTREEIMPLVRFLNTTATSQVYSTDCLHRAFPPAEDYIARASGILALPVSRTPRDYIILFREEV